MSRRMQDERVRAIRRTQEHPRRMAKRSQWTWLRARDDVIRAKSVLKTGKTGQTGKSHKRSDTNCEVTPTTLPCYRARRRALGNAGGI